MSYLADEDVVWDRQLFLYDIQATKAHVEALVGAGILDSTECDKLCASLAKLADAFAEGSFVLDERFEDGHSAIEAWLTEALGALGEKVHTGRSRNDQVLVASRLYMRDALEDLFHTCKESAAAGLSQAERYRDWPMPGYTHLQRAVVTSVGTWFAGVAEAFIDNAILAATTRDWINTNPLGTAAGYGVNLAIDRQATTDKLNFARTQLNPVYAQNSRGKFELQALSAISQCLLDVRRFAWDLSLYTTSEFGFVILPDRYTTGSSIMPNKCNPDVIELMRASYGVVAGAMSELQSILSLPSGYHRDLQGTKAPVLRALARGRDTMALMPKLIAGVTFDRDRLVHAIDVSLYATDKALELAAAGVPFREAYRRVKQDGADQGDPGDSLKAKVSPGAAGNLQLSVLRARLDSL
jgi:argininosuccinate lyase